MPAPIVVDTETYHAPKLKYSIRSLIDEQYTRHELFDCYMVSVSDGATCWAGHPRDFNWAALENRVLLSHNKKFDFSVISEMQRRQLIPKFTPADWQCTSNLSAFLCNQRALDNAVEALYGVKVSKAERANAEGKRWPQDFAPEQQTAMLAYARRDVYWPHKIWTDHADKWSEEERILSNLTIDQGLRGIQVDVALLNKYICDSHEMKINTEKMLPWLREDEEEDWDDFKLSPTSSKCIAEACRREGISCCPVKAESEEDYEAWEKLYAPQHPWILAVAAWRSINKLYKSFLTMKSRIRPDGTMPFGLKYWGAHCFTGEHEVLTPQGWQRLDEWTGGEIMQRTESGNLVFDSAIANVFPVCSDEKMLHAKNGQLEFICTPGHWLATINKAGKLVGRQAGEARNVRLQIPLSGDYIGGTEELSVWKIKLFAAIQADGHYLADCRSIRFRFSRPRKIERLRAILKESGLDWKEDSYPSEPGVTVFIIRQFPTWLENRKLWSAELLTWGPKTLETLVRELVHWDGTQCGPESIVYSTTIESNADWIATLAHLTNRAATRTIKKHFEENWKDSHIVCIRNRNQTRLKKTEWTEKAAPYRVFCPTSRRGMCFFRYRGNIFVSKQTGRWSGDSKINFQNMRRYPAFGLQSGLLQQDDKAVAHYVKEHGKTGKWPAEVKFALDFRALFIPRPGKKMIVSDLAQIEPRVLAWLSGNQEMINQVRSGVSVYEAFARANFGYTGGKMDKSTNEYKLIKIQVLQLGYQAGWEKFISTALKESGIDLTEADPEFETIVDPLTDIETKVPGWGAFARKLVRDFRAASPKTTAMWQRLEEGFRSSVGGDFVMTLPNGRKMTYRDVRAQGRMEKSKKDGKPYMKTEYTAEVGGRRVASYGGKLTENIVQAVARDFFASTLVRMHRAGLTILWTSHDESILEVDSDVKPQDIEKHMSTPPDWAPDFPLAAEAKEVKHYLK